MKTSPASTPGGDVDAARRTLELEMEEFLRSARTSLEGGREPPGLAFRVPTGLGKTSTALRLVAKHAPALLKHGHVVFYLPTLALAEQGAADFRRIAPRIRAQVVRGRDAETPKGVKMCIRADVAGRIAPLVRSVSVALCEDPETGKKAACAVGCPYLAQRRWGPRVLFTSHAYLTLGMPVPGNVALRVIDEKIWPTLTSVRDLTAEEWISDPRGDLPDDLKTSHVTVRFRVLEALKSGRCVIEELRRAGIGQAPLRALAAFEARQAPILSLNPAMPLAAAEKAIERFSWADWSVAIGRKMIFSFLADAWERRGTQRLTLDTVLRNGEKRTVLRLHRKTEMPQDAPTLFLDADANPTIVNALWPGAGFREILCTPKAHVVQIRERTLSDHYLLHHHRAEAHRRMVRDVISREVSAAKGRVLVVATRKVLAALRGDLRQDREEALVDLKGPLLGAEARWFGPNLQGLNTFEDFETAIIVGRIEPRVSDLERELRCLFGDDDNPLSFVGNGRFVRRKVAHRLANGSEHLVCRSEHPDPRGMALLEQMRECQSLQAAGRIRYMSPSRPKRVVLLSNLPLRGLEPHTVTTLEELAGLVHDRVDPAGFNRLAQALGNEPVPRARGLRLSKQGLHEDLRSAFPTAASAAEFRRGRSTSALSDLVRRLAHARGWPVTFLELRRQGGGHACPAVVFARPDSAQSEARNLWPDLRLTFPS